MHDSDYANQLGDHLERILEGGADSLEAIVEGLNASGLEPPTKGRWTPDSLVAELQRLGA
ncbi:MAG: hypothetical protein QHC78_11845 [Pigmentiphaga sp.]|uniref:recombinase-like helix-turn-helix domain-containing protein n=1 Tax=Pigmentiphaga sp. TaxID=1977564 RepID=UPI0029B7A211|nr:recombinase-like helix-turn-helix domain-containing protein [Pigmentiphaga sp.]MDX3906370.1 hypothetical protein [Pigmentiphaga sp.]